MVGSFRISMAVCIYYNILNCFMLPFFVNNIRVEMQEY